jgi:hypothetical protein
LWIEKVSSNDRIILAADGNQSFSILGDIDFEKLCKDFSVMSHFHIACSAYVRVYLLTFFATTSRVGFIGKILAYFY